MLGNIFFLKKKNKDQKDRDIILKEFFNMYDQKKAVKKAARESINDQKILIERYHKMIKVGQQ